MGIRLLLGLLLSFYGYTLNAQDDFIHYTSDHGLPSSEVYDVICDQKGFIWISTDRGVSRYDGYRFENFYTSDGLTDNVIIEMFEDKYGHIWFSANSGRLCYYDYADAKIHEYKYNNLLRKNLPSLVVIKSIRMDSTGTLFVGYLHYGAVSVTRDGKLSVMASYPSTMLEAFNVYFLEIEGQPLIYSQRREDGMVKPTRLHINFHGIRLEMLLPAAPDRRGDEYMCTRKNGACIFSVPGYILEIAPGKKPYVMPVNDDVRRIYEDRQGRVWICFRNEGVRRYEAGESLESLRYTTMLQGKYANTICEDKEQGIWIGVYQDALYYHPMMNLKVEKMKGVPTSRNVTCIGFKDGDLYFGTESDRLYRLRADGIFDSLILPTRQLAWIHELNGGLMVYGYQRCYIYKNRIQLIPAKLSSHIIYSVYQTDSIIYAGSHTSIKRYLSRPPYTELPSVRLFPTRFETVYNDHGRLLFGNSAGVHALAGDTMESCNSWFDKPCRTTAIQKVGTYLVFSTLGEGIRFLDSTKKQQFTLNTQCGLLSNNINTICYDKCSLWAASSFGLNEIRFTGDTFRVYAYTLSNGLKVSEIRKMEIHNGRLWLISPKGIYSFRLSDVVNNSVNIPLHILSVTNGDTVYAGEALLGNPEVRFNSILRIRYVGLSYKQNRNIQYRYRLLDQDKDWIYTRNTEIELAFLPEGHYTLELSASNEDGEWGPPVRFRFFIEPPFWRTWWFIFGTGLLIVGTILFIFIQRILRLQKENSVRAQLYEYRQQALVARMNPHFIFNSLNSIYYFIFNEEKDTAGKYLTRFASLMRRTLDLSTKEYVKLKEDLRALELYLEMEVWRFNGKFRFTLYIDEQVDQESITVPPMLVQPFVENAIKHGLLNLPEGEGQLHISYRFSNHNLECIVEDNGIGREEALRLKQSSVSEEHHSAGIAITLQRLETACEKNKQAFLLEYTDKTPETHSETGTRVRFYIPYIYDKSADH